MGQNRMGQRVSRGGKGDGGEGSNVLRLKNGLSRDSGRRMLMIGSRSEGHWKEVVEKGRRQGRREFNRHRTGIAEGESEGQRARTALVLGALCQPSAVWVLERLLQNSSEHRFWKIRHFHHWSEGSYQS